MPHLIGYFPGGGGASGPKKKAFADCTWEEVSEICKAGLAGQYWNIGDTKEMIYGDSTKMLRIIGFDHDIVSDAATYGRDRAGITLELEQVSVNLKSKWLGANSTVGQWYSSSDNYHSVIRKTLLPNYRTEVIPQYLSDVIVDVQKEFMHDSGAIRTVSDSLFILSANEIFGTYASGDGSEGTQYAYYTAGNSKVKKNTSNTDIMYWTRSKRYNKAYAYYVGTTGSIAEKSLIEEGLYAVPCMCI